MSKSDIDFIDLTDLAGADARETQGGERVDELLASAKEAAIAARVALAGGLVGEANDLMEAAIDAIYLARYGLAKARGDEAARKAIFEEANAVLSQD